MSMAGFTTTAEIVVSSAIAKSTKPDDMPTLKSNAQDSVSRKVSQPCWKEMYRRLKQLKEKTGIANLPQRGVHDPLLQSWINDQRRQCRIVREQPSEGDKGDEILMKRDGHGASPSLAAYSNNSKNVSNQKNSSVFTGLEEHKLTFERVLELERLGFSWDSPHDVEWKKRYLELKVYKGKHGHCRVPARDRENPELGRWVMTQRRQYALLKQNRKSRMTRERLRLLEMIDFEWVLREDYREKWIQHVKELKDFLAKYDHLDVASVQGPCSDLGKWVCRMKKQYRAYVDGNDSAHNLNKERFDELRNLGFHQYASLIKKADASVSSDTPSSKHATVHMKADSFKADNAHSDRLVLGKSSGEENREIHLSETSAVHFPKSDGSAHNGRSQMCDDIRKLKDEAGLAKRRFEEERYQDSLAYYSVPVVQTTKDINERIYQDALKRSFDISATDLFPAQKRLKLDTHRIAAVTHGGALSFGAGAESLALLAGSAPFSREHTIDPLFGSDLSKEMLIRRYQPLLMGHSTPLDIASSVPLSVHQRIVTDPCSYYGQKFALRPPGISPLAYVVLPKSADRLYTHLPQQRTFPSSNNAGSLSSYFGI